MSHSKALRLQRPAIEDIRARSTRVGEHLPKLSLTLGQGGFIMRKAKGLSRSSERDPGSLGSSFDELRVEEEAHARTYSAAAGCPA
jgi:hypothetical protein